MYNNNLDQLYYKFNDLSYDKIMINDMNNIFENTKYIIIDVDNEFYNIKLY